MGENDLGFQYETKAPQSDCPSVFLSRGAMVLAVGSSSLGPRNISWLRRFAGTLAAQVPPCGIALQFSATDKPEALSALPTAMDASLNELFQG